MTTRNETAPSGVAARSGEGVCLATNGSPDSKPGAATQGGRRRTTCPIVLGCQARLTADLLAETLEFAIGYGVNVLSALRLADDATAIEQFRDFDAAARCARKCATELRSLLEVGGAR